MTLSHHSLVALTAILITSIGSAAPTPATASGPPPATAGSSDDWATVDAGGDHTCGIRESGTLWCWGANYAGQLGTGDGVESTTPVRVGGRADWVSVSGGHSSTCAITANGSLWCWGVLYGSDYGTTPTLVDADHKWASISLGFGHACGVQSDHSLWCWGGNSYGQLGLGDLSPRSDPTRVGRSLAWAAVSPGDGEHTCAVKTTGTLWCWGDGSSGQLGTGDYAGATTRPTRVGHGSTWSSVSAGLYHSCATRSGSTLWCWGSNYYGQLGHGEYWNQRQDTVVPLKVGPGYAAVVSGTSFSCASRTDGTVRCWGRGGSGQLGDNRTHDRVSPVEAVGLTDVAVLSTGESHVCAVTTLHELYCWGANWDGQLGLGDTHNRKLPVHV